MKHPKRWWEVVFGEFVLHAMGCLLTILIVVVTVFFMRSTG